MELPERFWEKVDKSGECWIWTACLHEGYGWFSWQGKTVRAHRLAWQAAHGPVPAGHVVLHRCDNPACVRVEHMHLTTQAENRRDAARKGHAAEGQQQGQSAKLTPDKVREIRRRYAMGQTQKSIGMAYGISQTVVGRICARQSWANIP